MTQLAYGHIGLLPAVSGDHTFVSERAIVDDLEDRFKVGLLALTDHGLRTKEDGFTLEGFDGEEEGDGGVDARGHEDEGDRVPVVRASDDFFANEAGVEDGNDSELGGELDTGKHGGDRGDYDDESEWREIALGLFVGLGEESDGHEKRREKHRKRK